MNPTPSDCLELLNRATANVQADRQSHANIQTAIRILAELIESTKPKTE